MRKFNNCHMLAFEKTRIPRAPKGQCGEVIILIIEISKHEGYLIFTDETGHADQCEPHHVVPRDDPRSSVQLRQTKKQPERGISLVAAYHTGQKSQIRHGWGGGRLFGLLGFGQAGASATHDTRICLMRTDKDVAYLKLSAAVVVAPGQLVPRRVVEYCAGDN